MFYITGDIHGQYHKIKEYAQRFEMTEKDTIIIVGDVGVNYYQNNSDKKIKYALNELAPSIFCIQGNHEIRPENIKSYHIVDYRKGKAYVEDEFPSLYFGIDGEIYDFDGNETLVCGGAYSVDKYYRIVKTLLYKYPIDNDMVEKGLDFVNGNIEDSDGSIRRFLDECASKLPYGACGWFNDEQLSEESKKKIKKQLEDRNWKIDIVLSHTGPTKFEPVDMFISFVNQSIVDKTTEDYLDKLDDKLNYKHWYAGHYHVDRKVNDKFTFLFNDLLVLSD